MSRGASRGRRSMPAYPSARRRRSTGQHASTSSSQREPDAGYDVRGQPLVLIEARRRRLSKSSQRAFERRRPRPRGDRGDADSLALFTEPLAVAPARSRAARLLLALASEEVASKLVLVLLDYEHRADVTVRRHAVVRPLHRERGEDEVALERDRRSGIEMVADHRFER